jgi:hypothetical protein
MEMAERIEAGTGGICRFDGGSGQPRGLRGSFQALVQIRGKALARNQDKLFAYPRRTFSRPPTSAITERLRTVLGQVTNLPGELHPLGSDHSYAARAAAASLSSGRAPAGNLVGSGSWSPWRKKRRNLKARTPWRSSPRACRTIAERAAAPQSA